MSKSRIQSLFDEINALGFNVHVDQSKSFQDAPAPAYNWTASAFDASGRMISTIGTYDVFSMADVLELLLSKVQKEDYEK